MNLEGKLLEKITNDLINWIKISMKNSGGTRAIIGVSGGKDSSVTTALCLKALGKENVLGVLMPNGIQADIGYSKEICSFLEIKYTEVNIVDIFNTFEFTLNNIKREVMPEISENTRINLPPRIRMTLLYALSQSIPSSRVINTSNLSEDWIGYSTVYGDTAGAFSPLGMLTSDEVIQIGKFICLPDKFVVKKPSDGLTGKTDEDNFGFSYEVLNKYIREGQIQDPAIKNKIDYLHKNSRFKYEPIPIFDPNLPLG